MTTETPSVPNMHEIPRERLQRDELTDDRGNYPNDWVTSPLQATVIRQNTLTGAGYKEAIGYTFLLYSMKFPSVVRMDDGRLLMNASYEAQSDERPWVLLFSDDEGRSWSQPVPSQLGRCTLTNLGGNRLMSLGTMPTSAALFALRFSADGGKSWSDPEAAPPISDGRHWGTDVPYSHLVEGQKVTFVGAVDEHPGYEHWEESNSIFTRGIIRTYHLDTHEWDDPYLFPMDWGLSEASVTRAKNGDLVAVFRTQLMDGIRITTDHWMGLATTRSTDDGKTWEKPVQAFLYGHHHMNLRALPDGRLLMTYASRIGELEGMPYHGIEAVVSHDDGKTWDWNRRYILFRELSDQIMHSPGSVMLSDGSIFTTFMHTKGYTWDDGTVGPRSQKTIGNVSAVIWKPW
ncbi:MAG: exo-alpha-sialidase [Candidatus Latescibacterota bacterium]